MAFAQLAEECRRAGDNEGAVSVCLAGLAHHPGYLSARVTLSRALIELERLDEAQHELTIVLREAADNLAANRAMAEIYQKRGQMAEALEQYRRALFLAKYDPTLEHEVARIEKIMSPPPPEPKINEQAKAIEDFFDFDALLQQLGAPSDPVPPPAPPPAEARPPATLDSLVLPPDEGDPFSVLEQQLRESADRAPQPGPPVERDVQVLAELEDWLTAIIADRNDQPSA
jgi:tetratricopeptide (TPR) repeat protein